MGGASIQNGIWKKRLLVERGAVTFHVEIYTSNAPTTPKPTPVRDIAKFISQRVIQTVGMIHAPSTR